MRVLVACECSQVVCSAFRAFGHEAYSCDLQPCYGGHPEWHINSDCLPLLDGDCSFQTEDGSFHAVSGRWDLLIAHPPCPLLTKAANRSISVRCMGLDRVNSRYAERFEAAAFFSHFIYADCPRIAIENPVGVMNSFYRKPDQIVQPYQFGDPQLKTTCFWLKGLPLLVPTSDMSPPAPVRKGPTGKNVYWTEACKKGAAARARIRSQTFPGIALAMATQWGNLPQSDLEV